MATIVLVVIAFFILRNPVLRHLIDIRFQSIEKRYKLHLSYSDASFSGLRTIKLKGFTVVPLQRDTLVRINDINLSFKPLALLSRDIVITNLNLEETLINLRRKGNESNYLFLIENQADTSMATKSSNDVTDYGLQVSRVMNGLFNLVPSVAGIHDFRIKAEIDTNYLELSIPDLDISDHLFRTTVYIEEDSLMAAWNVEGLLDSDHHKVDISVKGQNSKIVIPFIKNRWNTLIAFDSASLSFKYERKRNEPTHLIGNVFVKAPLFNHARISPQDVKLQQSEIEFNLLIGNSYIEADSSTFISFNKIGFHPYFKYSIEPDKAIDLRIREESISAQDFFESLPDGLFTNLEGIKVKGTLNFDLAFQMELNRPDSLFFESKLRSTDFRILQFGKTNFAYINEPFIYTPFENGMPVREILVGEANPNYRKLNQIPEYLKYAILTSEDGQFFYHEGFIPDAIKQSIITNIKEKRFARGGSTITMQLVKNVFLNRSKHITRKLEEMLITWLIESQNIVTKDRMLEVYLNIIETGPMTYGVNEAAQFYFHKDVSKLTLAESIYIASIVPRPKLFKYSFDKEGNLRDYLSNYYSLVSGKMLSRGWISEYDYEHLSPEIVLKGPARSYIVTDSVPPEDVIIKERKGLLDILRLNIFNRKKDSE